MTESLDARRPWPPELDPGVHRTTIDGVDTLWADLPGPFMAALLFRAGRADETLASAGVGHLAEHLALEPFEGRSDFDPNGFVDELFTVFHATGRRELVAEFLVRLADALADPPVAQLETVRSVVRQESQRSPGVEQFMRTMRFGATGHGLPGLAQLGLTRLSADDVHEWARASFTIDNAVLLLSGPPPDRLRMPLPRGRWRPPPAPRPLDRLRFPLVQHWPLPVVGMAATVASTDQSVSGPARILHERLRRSLRTAKGLVYDVELSLEPLDARTAHLTLTAETGMDRAASVRDDMLVVLEDLVRSGPTAGEVAVVAARAREGLEQPLDFGALDYWAHMHLLAAPARTAAALADERGRLTSADCVSVYREMRETLIMALPEGIDAPSGFASDDPPPDEPIAGTRYKPALGWLPFTEKRPMLIGEEGFAIVDRAGQFVVRYRDCVGWETHSDGSRSAWRSDGSWVSFHPRGLKRGAEAVATLDARMPASLHVPVDCDEEENRRGPA